MYACQPRRLDFRRATDLYMALDGFLINRIEVQAHTVIHVHTGLVRVRHWAVLCACAVYVLRIPMG